MYNLPAPRVTYTDSKSDMKCPMNYPIINGIGKWWMSAEMVFWPIRQSKLWTQWNWGLVVYQKMLRCQCSDSVPAVAKITLPRMVVALVSVSTCWCQRKKYLALVYKYTLTSNLDCYGWLWAHMAMDSHTFTVCKMRCFKFAHLTLSSQCLSIQQPWILVMMTFEVVPSHPNPPIVLMIIQKKTTITRPVMIQMTVAILWKWNRTSNLQSSRLHRVLAWLIQKHHPFFRHH